VWDVRLSFLAMLLQEKLRAEETKQLSEALQRTHQYRVNWQSLPVQFPNLSSLFCEVQNLPYSTSKFLWFNQIQLLLSRKVRQVAG
jgi:hypothetical protein